MKNLFKLLLSIAICELSGFIGAIFTISAIPTWYTYLNKPFFSPPNWLFGPVWTILYFLMGVSFYLIWTQSPKKKGLSLAIKTFLLQLILNFIWTPVFFGLKSPVLRLVTIISMWFAILATIAKFYPLSKIASYLLIPYLLWVSFATLLNASIALLN